MTPQHSLIRELLVCTLRMMDPPSRNNSPLNTWVVDFAGNVAMSGSGLAFLGRIGRLIIPAFTSTEQAIEWGSRLNAAQHATLVDIQRTASNAARGEVKNEAIEQLEEAVDALEAKAAGAAVATPTPSQLTELRTRARVARAL